MNLASLPKDEPERLQQHPLGRKLGPIESWPEETFYMVLAHHHRIPFRYIGPEDVDYEFFQRHQSFFIRSGQIPLQRFPEILVVADPEPWEEKKLQDLLQEFELGIRRVLITQRNYDALLGSLSEYRPPPTPEVRQAPRVFFANMAWDQVETSQIFQEIVRRADLMGASDIHLEPAEDHLRVRLRVHGDLLVQRKLSLRDAEQVLKAIKLQAHLLTTVAGTFRSSRVRMLLPHGKTLDLRVELSPTVEGESVVLRLLDSGNIDRRIDQLNLPEAYYPLLLDSISKTSGLIIVTGPTGSGKTTTLYTILQHLNRKDTKIITIEDPVEYRIRGFSQIQIDYDKGITFPTAIRSCLRQDPDILLIGEIRDEETARLAVAAAETGHLVFSTLHTNNAIEALSRLDRLDVDRYQLQTLIRLVIAQRLVGALCPSCKTGREIKSHEQDLLQRLAIPFEPGQLVYEKRGCAHCNGIGTVGRTAVYSFFAPSDAIRELMGTDCPVLDIIKKARAEGFKPIIENALLLWLEGKAAFSEVHALED